MRGRAAVLAIVIAVTAACGSGPDPAGPGDPEEATIVVGLPPGPAAAPLDIAIRKGYFTKEGLTVTKWPLPDTVSALPLMSTGEIDVVLGDYVSVLLAQETGPARLKVIADMAAGAPGGSQLAVRKNSKIREIADLKGRVIGVNRFKSLQTLSVERLLKDQGLSARDVEFAEVGSGRMRSMLDAGKIDAAFLGGGGPGRDARVIADPLNGLPVAGWVATDDWVDAAPQTSAAFQRAIARAKRVATNEGRIPLDFRVEVDGTRLQRLADLMHDLGYTRGTVDAWDLLPPSQAAP